MVKYGYYGFVDEFGNVFNSNAEKKQFYNEYNTISKEFYNVIGKFDGNETSDNEISNLFNLPLENKTPENLRLMKDMINKYKYPHSAIRSQLLAGNAGKRVEKRTVVRGRDILDKDAPDLDDVIIDRDPEKFRKKKSTKSKPKRKVVKKCKCK